MRKKKDLPFAIAMSPFSDRNFLCVDHHRGEGKMTSGFSKSDSNIANSGSECHFHNNLCRFSTLVSKVESRRGSFEALSISNCRHAHP